MTEQQPSAENDVQYDVIIVGGRPAGATLAARLGKRGISTLIVERDTFPSLPPVSSPIIYSSTMALLDEIGALETEYARDTPQIHRVIQSITLEMQTVIALPDGNGRNYAYAVDRARFDAALWDTAMRYQSVTGWQGFSVTDLLWEGDDPTTQKVVGIVGQDNQKREIRVRARVVIGADGRFSLVGRKTGAAVREQHTDYPTSLYYAYWRGLKPYDDGSATAVAYAGIEPGYGYLVMDSADDTAAVVVEGQSALIAAPPGGAEDYYVNLLRRHPAVWRRVEGAELVTSVRGMRDVGNLYRQPGGAGWALVGDAYHQKDPLDGQGIYDAVFTAKALAFAIQYWLNGEKTWTESLDWYDETVRIRTYGAYRAVIDRVRGSLYAEQPAWITESMSRWLMDDPGVQGLFGRFLTRQIPADALDFMTPPVMVRAMLRGGLRDLRSRMRDTLGL